MVEIIFKVVTFFFKNLNLKERQNPYNFYILYVFIFLYSFILDVFIHMYVYIPVVKYISL